MSEPNWEDDPNNPFPDEINPLAVELQERIARRPPRAKHNPQDEAPLTLIEIEAENVMCLKAIRIQPDRTMTIVGGENGAGKSSVLNCIVMALAGGRAIPEVPVRIGEDEAFIRLDLGNLIVERTWQDGKSALRVTSPEGAQFSSPQAMLNTLCPEFDPLAFARSTPKDQADRLRKLVGLDFSALDGKRAKLYADRTDVGRDLAKSEASLKNMPRHVGAPKAAVSVAELTAELNQAHAVNRANDDQRRQVDEIRAYVCRLQQRAADLQTQLDRILEQQTDVIGQIKSNSLILSEDEVKAAALQDVDTAPLSAAISQAELTNRMVRENAQREAFAESVKELAGEQKTLTKQIEQIDAEKACILSETIFPAPGLGFDEQGGVTLRGLPFAQASSAEQLRASVALGFASGPRLNLMLIRDGSLLDAHSLALVAELAAEYGGQVLVERVSSSPEGCTVFIVDGEVQG